MSDKLFSLFFPVPESQSRYSTSVELIWFDEHRNKVCDKLFCPLIISNSPHHLYPAGSSATFGMTRKVKFGLLVEFCKIEVSKDHIKNEHITCVS